MICERCTYGRGSHTCLLGLRGQLAKIRRSEVERVEKLARYADELVRITKQLRRTADVIEMVESEPALIGALMDSGDWRMDEITQLRRHVADLRARIGNY